jgi:hypothetical protein
MLKHMPNLLPRRYGNRNLYLMRDIRDSYPELFESIKLKREMDGDEDEFGEASRLYAKHGA